MRREKAVVHSGRLTRPGTGSLHPVAIRAAVEATRLLKPLVPESRKGDLASRQAGPTGMAERLVLATKPGNAGGGKEPQLKADARSNDRKRDWR